jgi:uncharacterized membrane protein YgdD (TMEM256/DUF423 family)
MYHALFLILIALLNDLVKKAKSYLLFSRFGVILFSLSIYLLAKQLDFDFKVIGFVTLSVDSYL